MRLLLALLTIALMTAFGPQAAADELPLLELQAGKDGAALAPYVRFARQSPGTAAPQLQQILRGPLERIQGSSTSSVLNAW